MSDRMKKEIQRLWEGATQEQVDAMYALYEKQLKAQAEQTAERVDTLQKQLSAANTQIKQFESMDIDKIKASAREWQDKYAASEKEWNARLDHMKYVSAAKDAVADIKFTSNSARKAFLSELEGKKLPLDGDRLTGFSDFLDRYKEDDPGAFISDEPKPEVQEPQMRFVPGTQTNFRLDSTPEMDEAQRAFAERGVNFDSIKRFSELTQKGVM